MRKLGIFILLLIVIFFIGLYTLIPNKQDIIDLQLVNCHNTTATRILYDENSWKQWWPSADTSLNNHTFSCNNVSFNVKQHSFNGTILSTTFSGDTIDGNFAHAASGSDSLALVWKYTLTYSTNPIKRIRQYNEARLLKKTMMDVMGHLKTFLENPDKVYGINIKEIRVTDTVLVSSFLLSSTPPSVDGIYTMIEALKKYIAVNGAVETAFPMLNVTEIDSTHFKTRVAIPVNKTLKETPSIQLKRMIPGRILVTEITGGPATIKKAFIQLHYYLEENDLASPAIPFESLVTNRLQEKDSTRWITRIYYPIL